MKKLVVAIFITLFFLPLIHGNSYAANGICHTNYDFDFCPTPDPNSDIQYPCDPVPTTICISPVPTVTLAPTQPGSSNNQTVNNYRTAVLNNLNRAVNSLNLDISSLSSISSLNPDQKTTVTTQIQSAITTLTNAKTKIAADTTIDQIRTDAQQATPFYSQTYAKVGYIKVLDKQLTRLNTVSTVVATLTTQLPQSQDPKIISLKNQLSTISNNVTTVSSNLTGIWNTTIQAVPVSTNIFTLIRSQVSLLNNASRTLTLDAKKLEKISQEVASLALSQNPTPTSGQGAVGPSIVPPVSLPAGCHYVNHVCSDMACTDGKPCPPCKPILVCPSGIPVPSIYPSITCIPRPICLDGNPKCQIPEPAGGWCPSPTPKQLSCGSIIIDTSSNHVIGDTNAESCLYNAYTNCQTAYMTVQINKKSQDGTGFIVYHDYISKPQGQSACGLWDKYNSANLTPTSAGYAKCQNLSYNSVNGLTPQGCGTEADVNIPTVNYNPTPWPTIPLQVTGKKLPKVDGGPASNQ